MTARPAEQPRLRMPPRLPDGLVRAPRILELVDADAISASLVHDYTAHCPCDLPLSSCLEIAQVCGTSLDPESRVRCAASAMTAFHHVDVLINAGVVTLAVRRTVGDARRVLLEELADLIDARTSATRPGGSQLPGLPNLLILLATSRVYAPAVRQLRLLGIPCWLLVPGYYAAASLRSCACAVSFIGPDDRLDRPGRQPDNCSVVGFLPSSSGSRP